MGPVAPCGGAMPLWSASVAGTARQAFRPSGEALSEEQEDADLGRETGGVGSASLAAAALATTAPAAASISAASFAATVPAAASIPAALSASAFAAASISAASFATALSAASFTAAAFAAASISAAPFAAGSAERGTSGVGASPAGTGGPCSWTCAKKAAWTSLSRWAIEAREVSWGLPVNRSIGRRLGRCCAQASVESSTTVTSWGWQSSRRSVFVVRSSAGFQASTCGGAVR